MRVKIELPDDLWEHYQKEAGRKRKAPEKLLVEILDRYQACTADERFLVLAPELIKRLEEALERHFTQPHQLVELIEVLARIRIGDIRVEATPAQLRELAHKAERQGKTTEQLVRETYQAIARSFFRASSTPEGVPW